jgi:hypothetical protein
VQPPSLVLSCVLCDSLGRGCALLDRVAVDTFDLSVGARIIRPLRNVMRMECEAALAELGQSLQDEVQQASVAAVGAAACIGDLMKDFVALLQVNAAAAANACPHLSAVLQRDKCTTASTLVRAVEKLAPCPGWHASAPAAPVANSVAEPAVPHPACALCRLPVVLSLDFRHSDFADVAGGAGTALCYSCKVVLLGCVSCLKH